MTRTFRERQIYHRADGVVHFVSMSSRTQIAMAILALGFLSWVAYASVNVVFKEQIILAKDRNFRLMESTLQTRIAQSQRAYDEVNILNDIIRDEFDAAMRELDGRHLALSALFEEKKSLDDQINGLSAALASAGAPGTRNQANRNRVMVRSVPEEPTARVSKTPRLRESSFNLLGKERSSFALNTFRKGDGALSTDQHIRQTVALMRAQQAILLTKLEEGIQLQKAELQSILSATGVEPAMLVAQSMPTAGSGLAVGGPMIELADAEEFVNGGVEMNEEDNSDFFRHSYRIATHLDQLEQLKTAMTSIPLSMPLKSRHRVSDEFGRRVDPFNGRWAFHPGMDFAADWQSPVLVTAPGVVSFVGTRTGYGKTVEIDHGNGFKTRYAHLHRITVKRGQTVELQDRIGLVGSTGRATGPHLHYEIRFNGKLRDPRRFLEAGRYVFES